jgi:hypothetical protein
MSKAPFWLINVADSIAVCPENKMPQSDSFHRIYGWVWLADGTRDGFVDSRWISLEGKLHWKLKTWLWSSRWLC